MSQQKIKSTFENEKLWNSKLFKSPKMFLKAYYELIYKTLGDHISHLYMCTYSKWKEGQKFSKLFHRYLIFKDGTDLERMRKMVHQMFPSMEVIDDCPNQDCICQMQVKKPKSKRIIKRRGFGYITESQVKECVKAIQLSDITCRFEKYRKRQKVSKLTSPDTVKCDHCEFVAKSSFGYRSHVRAHHNADKGSKISKVCS